LRKDKSAKKARHAWTAACYNAFAKGFLEVYEKWPLELEFDWLNFCDRLRDKWFYLPLNIGWSGVENWGSGSGAGVDLDDLLRVFKHNRNAACRPSVEDKMCEQLGTSRHGQEAYKWFLESLEVGVYPKTLFLDDLPDTTQMRMVKHKVLRWVADLLLEAARKFPEVDQETLAMGVYFAPGPILEQSEASMWECCEYIRKLEAADAVKQEARAKVLSHCKGEARHVNALLPTTVLDAFDILAGEPGWLEVREALFKSLTDGAPTTRQERVARIMEVIPKRDVRKKPKAGMATRGLSFVLGAQVAAGSYTEEVEADDGDLGSRLFFCFLVAGALGMLYWAIVEKLGRGSPDGKGPVPNNPSPGRSRRTAELSHRRLPEFHIAVASRSKVRPSRASTTCKMVGPFGAVLAFLIYGVKGMRLQVHSLSTVALAGLVRMCWDCTSTLSQETMGTLRTLGDEVREVAERAGHEVRESIGVVGELVWYSLTGSAILMCLIAAHRFYFALKSIKQAKELGEQDLPTVVEDSLDEDMTAPDLSQPESSRRTDQSLSYQRREKSPEHSKGWSELRPAFAPLQPSTSPRRPAIVQEARKDALKDWRLRNYPPEQLMGAAIYRVGPPILADVDLPGANWSTRGTQVIGLCRMKGADGEWDDSRPVLDAFDGMVVETCRLHLDPRMSAERSHYVDRMDDRSPMAALMADGSMNPLRVRRGTYRVGVVSCVPPHKIQSFEIGSTLPQDQYIWNIFFWNKSEAWTARIHPPAMSPSLFDMTMPQIEATVESYLGARQQHGVWTANPETHLAYALKRAQNEIKATVYCIDSEIVLDLISSKAFTSRLPVRMIIDRNNLLGPSCVEQNGLLRQLVTTAELHQASGEDFRPFELRSCLPVSAHRGGFKSLHAKCFRIDSDVYVGGSFNPTANAVANNEEHLVVIEDRAVCKKVDSWFEKLWKESRLVTTAELDEIAEKLKRLKEERAAKKDLERRAATPKLQPKRNKKKEKNPSPVQGSCEASSLAAADMR
jgi:hypothetical protein